MEHRLFDPADPPEWLDPEWWRGRPHCDHLGSPTGAHAARLEAAADLAWKASLNYADSAPVVDLGAGDGALLSLLPKWLRTKSWGYDIIRADVWHAAASRFVKVYLRNVVKALSDPDSHRIKLGPVVVLTEVLEHMADPHGFLALLAARPEVRFIVASSPVNETPDSHEWNHAWCWDREGYGAMFREVGFESREVQIVEWSQLWLFERRVELTTAEAVAALKDERASRGWPSPIASAIRRQLAKGFTVEGVVATRCVNDTDGDGDCAACAHNPDALCRQPVRFA